MVPPNFFLQERRIAQVPDEHRFYAVAFNALLCQDMAQYGVVMNAKQRGMFHRGVQDVRKQDELIRKTIQNTDDEKGTSDQAIDDVEDVRDNDRSADDQIITITSDPIKKMLQQHTRIECGKLSFLDGWHSVAAD